MPTATNPATPRQIGYLRALADERRELRDQPLVNAAFRALDDTAYLDRNDASRLIDQLVAIRVPRTGPTAARSAQVSAGTLAPTPSPTTRAGRMLNAGGIEATAVLPDGRHVTLKIRTRKPVGRGWTNGQPGDDGARTTITVLGSRIGWVNVDASGRWLVTLRTRNDSYRAAAEALFAYAAGQDTGLTHVREASRCGRCMRTLTDPVSIDRGVGPECFGHTTGSVHVPAGDLTVGTATTITGATVTGQPGDPTELDAGAFADAAMAVAAASRAAAQGLSDTANFVRNLAADGTPREELDADRVHRQISADHDLAVAQQDARDGSLAHLGFTPVATLTADQQRARDLISEALDAYCSDEDRDFAMTTFDQLAGR